MLLSHSFHQLSFNEQSFALKVIFLIYNTVYPGGNSCWLYSRNRASPYLRIEQLVNKHQKNDGNKRSIVTKSSFYFIEMFSSQHVVDFEKCICPNIFLAV